ncbi:MAG: flagellar hook-length control protein FliK [Planctomycetes bacterium]|nr:flagellar hook-length control protein FliK [Planctomycetota bacterium]
MTEQTLNSFLGPSSTQESSMMGGLQTKNQTGKTETGDNDFHPVLKESMEDMEPDTDQSRVLAGQRQSQAYMTGDSRLFKGMYVNGDSLSNETGQVLAGMGEPGSEENEVLPDIVSVPVSDASSTPVHEDSLLVRLLSGVSQTSDTDIELPGNLKGLQKAQAVTGQILQNSNTQLHKNPVDTILETVAAAKAGVPGTKPLINSSTGITAAQGQGSGALSGTNTVNNIGSEVTLPLPTTEKKVAVNPNSNLNFPLPKNSVQGGVEEALSHLNKNGTGVAEKQAHTLSGQVFLNNQDTNSAKEPVVVGAQTKTLPDQVFLNNQDTNSAKEPVVVGAQTKTLPGQVVLNSTKTLGQGLDQTVKPANTVANIENTVQEKPQLSSEVLNTAGALKTGTSLGPKDGVKNSVPEQQVLGAYNAISQGTPNVKPPVRGDSVQKEKDSGKNSSVSKAGQYADVASSTDDTYSNTLKGAESVARAATVDSVIVESQGIVSRDEANPNPAFIKQDLEQKVQSINTSKEIIVSPTPESQSTDMTENIAQRAKLFLRGGKSEVRLQLNPPELGNLKMKFTVVDDVLEAKISVEKSMVKDVIEKDIPRIRELLSNADIDVGKFDVSLQDKDGARQELINKGFLSDTDTDTDAKGKSDGDLSSGDRESVNEDVDEEEMAQADTNTDSINYLV